MGSSKNLPNTTNIFSRSSSVTREGSREPSVLIKSNTSNMTGNMGSMGGMVGLGCNPNNSGTTNFDMSSNFFKNLHEASSSSSNFNKSNSLNEPKHSASENLSKFVNVSNSAKK